MHRPGAGALFRAPDAISRHPEGRDQSILARAADWERQRSVIKRVQEGILRGEFDAEEPELVAIDRLAAEALEPLPTEVLEDAGVLDWSTGAKSYASQKEGVAEVAAVVSDLGGVMEGVHSRSRRLLFLGP